MIIDYRDREPTERYKLMSQTIIPRPIAWIVTENQHGVINIAPFSYFIGLSSKPATMIVSIGHKSDGSEKDTLKNIRQMKKCTICMVDETHLEAMHFSSKELGENESEAIAFNIETKKLIDEFPPMVKDVPVAFFCELYQEIELKGSKTIPIIIEIKKQFINDKIVTDEEKIIIDYAPIARVGKSYALLGKNITAPAIK